MGKFVPREEMDRQLAENGSAEASGPPMKKPDAIRRIKTYDFTRPDKFSLDQIRTVSIMHETFARLTTTTLSAALRTLAHVHVVSVDQMTYEEFIRSIANPTTLAVIHMEPLKGSAILEIDPAVTFSVVDRLLGGQGEKAAFTREITDIEQSIIEGVVALMLGNLRESWAAVIDLRPRTGQIEAHPQFAQIVPPKEMIVLVSMAVKVSEAEGMMNLVLPYLTIEPIIPKLSQQYWYSSLRRGGGNEMALKSFTLDVPAELFFEGEKLSLRDLGRLKKGSLVKLPGYGQGNAFLRMGGRTLFGLKARPAGRRKPRLYDVAAKTPLEKLPSLEPKKDPSTPAEIQAMESGMREAIREMGREIGETLAGLKSAIGTLRQKQEEMADQLAFGAQQPESPEAKQGEERSRPFDFMRRTDPDRLLRFIEREHPQTIALVLSYLEPQKASAVLGALPPELAPDVARRIACMDRVHPEVLQEVERVLEKKLSTLSSQEFMAAGGIDDLVEILNVADRSTEKLVVETLAGKDLALVEEIKRRMIVFEDIILLDRKSAEKVIRKTDADVLLRALKAAPENVRDFIWGIVPHAEVEGLKRGLKELGPVRLHDVERAQQRIVASIREMEEAGEIVVARPGEEKVVE